MSYPVFGNAALFARLQFERINNLMRRDADTDLLIEAAVADVISQPGIRSAAETAQRAIDLLTEHGVAVATSDVLVETVLQLGGRA